MTPQRLSTLVAAVLLAHALVGHHDPVPAQ